MKHSLELLHRIGVNGNIGSQDSGRARLDPMIRTTIRPKIILFVDAEPFIQRARRIIFEALGYCVLTAASGEEAFTLLHSNDVDAVVLEYRIAGIDGEETAQRIRITNPAVPIVLCSSHLAVPPSASKIVDAVVDKARVHALLVLLERLVDQRPTVALQALRRAV